MYRLEYYLRIRNDPDYDGILRQILKWRSKLTFTILELRFLTLLNAVSINHCLKPLVWVTGKVWRFLSFLKLVISLREHSSDVQCTSKSWEGMQTYHSSGCLKWMQKNSKENKTFVMRHFTVFGALEDWSKKVF